jgi:IclR family pca regulon transcriptional regulator
VLLAALSDDQIASLLLRTDPKQMTEYTVLNKSKIQKEIVRARKEGYALVEDEVVVGFRSIAVPVRSYNGRIVAALNVGVQSDRIKLSVSMKEHLPLLLREASSLGLQLV